MLVKLNVIATIILVVSIIMVAPAPAASTSPFAKEGCQSRCGSVNISYPFGMGSPDCYYNKWFEILCLNDRPHLKLNQDGGEPYEVLEIRDAGYDMEFEIRSNTSNMRLCEDTSKSLGPNLTGTPFYYSPSNNFMLVGSGIATINGLEGGCASISDGRRRPPPISNGRRRPPPISDGRRRPPPAGDINPCYGLNCCQAKAVDSYSDWTEMKVNYLSLNAVTGKNSCASAFLMGMDLCTSAYGYGMCPTWKQINISLFSDPSGDLTGIVVPILLRWKITMPDHEFRNNKYCTYGFYATGVEYWACDCPCGFRGNPYIVNGCQDRTFDCSSKSYIERNLKSILVGGIFSLITVLSATSYLLYKTIRRRMNTRLKEKMFKRNGGALLQKYLSSNQNIMEKVRLFTGKDMNKATDQFNDNRVLGRGGQGTVYKGMLVDGKIVAIKKSKVLVNANQVEEFINEIIILSQIDHRNVVKLFGCCLEMDVPLLVYEYVPNGTLYNLIHNDNTEFPLTWEVRLRISSEVAESLAYLHSATSLPIYHRDIKSSNILLDEKYKAKVADFGTSRHIGVDQTHLTTLVKGTFGYLDPEYFQSSQFTEKSDVYSFGVVLVELLTGLKPICFSEEEQSHLNLATRFLLAIEENCVHVILDPHVIKTSTTEEREAIIRLSQQCLNINGRNRPSMKEIVMELQGIKRSALPLRVLENSYEKVDRKGNGVELSQVGISFQSSDDSFLSSSF